MSHPSNKQLAKEIEGLAAELGVEVSTSSLKSKDALLAKLEELQVAKAAKADDDDGSSGDGDGDAGKGEEAAKADDDDGSSGDGDDRSGETPPGGAQRTEDDAGASDANDPPPGARRPRVAPPPPREPMPPSEPPEPLERREVLRVARGKSLTSRRGILDAGTELKPGDLHDDPELEEERIDELLEAGAVVLERR